MTQNNRRRFVRARRAGGIRRSRCALVLTPDAPDRSVKNASEVSELLSEAINQLRRGQLDPRVANGIGYLASIQLRAFEQGMLDERIARVEKTLGFIAIPELADSVDEGSEHSNGDK